MNASYKSILGELATATTPVRDFMTRNVKTLRMDETLDLEDELLNWRKYRHLPVVDREGKLRGLVSHRDLMNEFASSIASEERKEKLVSGSSFKVEDIMIWNATTIGPNATLAEAAKKMCMNKCGCLPVVDDEGFLLGIISEADFVSLFQHWAECEETCCRDKKS